MGPWRVWSVGHNAISATGGEENTTHATCVCNATPAEFHHGMPGMRRPKMSPFGLAALVAARATACASTTLCVPLKCGGLLGRTPPLCAEATVV